MASSNNIAFFRSVPCIDDRRCLVANYEGQIDSRRVLFLGVHHYGRMKCSGAELVPGFAIEIVNVTAWVNNKWPAESRHLNAQSIIMPVRTASVQTAII